MLTADTQRECAVGFRQHVTAFGLHVSVHLTRRDVGIRDYVRASAPRHVDIAAQLVNMLIAQRAYQANTKTISTTDGMLQTLTQMLT